MPPQPQRSHHPDLALRFPKVPALHGVCLGTKISTQAGRHQQNRLSKSRQPSAPFASVFVLWGTGAAHPRAVRCHRPRTPSTVLSSHNHQQSRNPRCFSGRSGNLLVGDFRSSTCSKPMLPARPALCQDVHAESGGGTAGGKKSCVPCAVLFQGSNSGG